MKQTQGCVDYALSYAGEDVAVAHLIAERLRTLGFQVFVAEDLRSALAGEDGEAFFKRLFSEAKQVVVLISPASPRSPLPQTPASPARMRPAQQSPP